VRSYLVRDLINLFFVSRHFDDLRCDGDDCFTAALVEDVNVGREGVERPTQLDWLVSGQQEVVDVVAGIERPSQCHCQEVVRQRFKRCLNVLNRVKSGHPPAERVLVVNYQLSAVDLDDVRAGVHVDCAEVYAKPGVLLHLDFENCVAFIERVQVHVEPKVAQQLIASLGKTCRSPRSEDQ